MKYENSRKEVIEMLGKSLGLGIDSKEFDDISDLFLKENVTVEVLKEFFSKNFSRNDIVVSCEEDGINEEKTVWDVEKPLISVIIPTYGGYLPIEKTIDSVLCQTYRNLEVIVMDDKGNSVTRDLMLRVYQKNEKVHYYQSKSKVLTGSAKRKAGFLKAKGKYVVFLDHDDFYLDSTFFETAVAFLEGMDEHGRKRRERFSFYAANAFNYLEKEDKYQITRLNVSGEYSGKEYLYKLQLAYSKPLSVFPAVFVKEKMNYIMEAGRLPDSNVYMIACLEGNAYISDRVVGAYRIGANVSTQTMKFKLALQNLEEKRKIMIKAKEKYPEKDWDKWLLKQAEWYLDFFYRNGMPPTLADIFCLEIWGFLYCHTEFFECGKCYFFRYIGGKI